jgi:Tfp pilus assembly protein PilF
MRRDARTSDRARSTDDWIETFGFVMTRDALRSERRRYQYEVFSGSKALAVPWLTVAASIGGALGGTLVSGALWDDWLQPLLWLAVAVGSGVTMRWLTLRISGSPLAFLQTWCFWWGILIGACAVGAAQVENGVLAYGIAVVVGFLIGIVQGVYEPEDLESHDAFFGTGMVSAPVAACLAAWLYREVVGGDDLLAVALAGGVAGAVFLAPAMAVLLAKLDKVAGLVRVASLLLHRDETAGEAVPVLDAALRLAPEDPALWDRRGLAHALAGDIEAGEADWSRHLELLPGSGAPDESRGWLHLRRGRPADAAAAFERASARSKRSRGARVGLGLARLSAGDAEGAVEALAGVPASRRTALIVTYLAEATLAAGDAAAAERLADEAIDELDSIHARTWLVRGDARHALGDHEGAARDYSRAWGIEVEEGIQERALAGLDTIGYPLDEEELE